MMKYSNQIGILGETLFNWYFDIILKTSNEHYDSIVKETKVEIKTSIKGKFVVKQIQHQYLQKHNAHYCFVYPNKLQNSIDYYFLISNRFKVGRNKLIKSTNIMLSRVKKLSQIHFKISFNENTFKRITNYLLVGY